MYTNEVMYEQLPWDTDFTGALKFASLIEAAFNIETLVFMILW